MAGLSGRLAEHLAGTRWESLPAEAVVGAKRALLDALGVSLAATRLGEGCGVFLDMAAADGGAALSTILGRSVKVPPAQAAFANGALAHAMDFEDTHDRSATHPNSATVPAALAIAEARDAIGKDLLTALAVGCDFVCRLGLGLEEDPSEKGWYTPAILSAFGAAAAAGNLLRLDKRGMLDALSLTLCQATCSAEIKRSPDSLIRSVREAFSARAGVQAALLAEKGITGFDLPIDGKAGLFGLYGGGNINEAALGDRLGERFEGAFLSFKPWPTCRGTHVYIDLLLRLMREHEISANAIETVEIEVNSLNLMLCNPPAQKQSPRTLIDAKFSLPFTLAVAAVRGDPTLADFTAQSLRDPALLEFASRVTHRLEPAWPYQEATRGRLTLRLLDGRAFTLDEHIAPGHPDRPLSDEQLRAKFRTCAAIAEVAPNRIETIIGIVANLENHTARELADALR